MARRQTAATRAQAGWGAAALLAAGLGTVPVRAEQVADLSARVQETSAAMRRTLEHLGSRDPVTRLAAMHEIARSNNPALIDATVSTMIRSDDELLRAFALRIAFRQVRALVARLDPPVPANVESQAVVQACGNAVQYTIEKYSYEKGGFEVRGQDHVGVGNVSGNTVSLTIEYGCSFSGTLDKDGSLVGLVSAPYKKGALPARMMLR